MIEEHTSHDAYFEFLHWRDHHRPGDSVKVNIQDDNQRFDFIQRLERMKVVPEIEFGNPLVVRI